jgi:hypothetical protein
MAFPLQLIIRYKNRQENKRTLSFIRLLKNTHLRRCPHPSSLQRTSKYASLFRISGALHPGIFEQPDRNYFFSRLLHFTIPYHRIKINTIFFVEKIKEDVQVKEP